MLKEVIKYLQTNTKAETATIIIQASVDLEVKIIFGEIYMPPEKIEKIDIIKNVNSVFGEENTKRGLNKCCAWKVATTSDCKSAQALKEGKFRIPESYYREDGYHIEDKQLMKMVKYLRNYFDNQHKEPKQPSEEKKAEIIKRKLKTGKEQQSNVEKKQKKNDNEESENPKPGCSY